MSARSAIVCVAILLASSRVDALNPRLDISQYAHTSWRLGDTLPAVTIAAMAQTPDGYLWLGTTNGLFRFDGIRATPWHPPLNQSLPSNRILQLITTRDGALWIGTDRGVASWKDGQLRSHTGPADTFRTTVLLEDHDGAVWAVVSNSALRGLCTFTETQAECRGDSVARLDARGLFHTRKGELWVGTRDGVWRWKPAPARFYPLGHDIDGFQEMAEDATGALLLARRGRVERLAGERFETLFLYPPAMRESKSYEMLMDRDGGLWLGEPSTGLLHFHRGAMDVFGETDGLSSNAVNVLFEDREGSVWVATPDGLHRFRDVAVASASTRQGLSSRVNALAASTDGSVWMAMPNGLARSNEGGARPIQQLTLGGLSAGAHALLSDRRGRIWVATVSGVGHLEHDRYSKLNAVPGGLTRGIAEDGAGTIWIVNQDLGVMSVDSGDSVSNTTPWSAMGRTGPATAMAPDPSRGVWVGFFEGGIVHFDGGVRSAYGPGEGLAPGPIRHLHFDSTGTLWIAGDAGLTRLTAGRLATLNASTGLPCDETEWALADDAGALWVAMACGLVRVRSAEIATWAVAGDRQDLSRRIPVDLFTASAGFRPTGGYGYSLPVVKSTDGRLWFRSATGVMVLDPAAIPFNRVPPPVHIEAVTADRQVYHPSGNGATTLSLPPLTRDLQIDYAALSLVAPEKNRFRYQLEGRDTGWQDVGNRRQAFYSNLSPRRYRFRVIASNNDGVWNEEGAAIDFEIAAAYYQTNWFIALVAGMLLTLVWAAHRLRLRIVETHEREITALNEKLMSAQEQERIRIAGELHDGVMQEMLAATMMLGTAKRRIAADSDAHATIDKVQQKLVHAGTEIRQLSHDLHPPALQNAGLPDALRTHCEDFSASCGVPITCEADDRVHDLSRGAALALFRIVQEALGNAAKHSKATRITVGLTRADGHVTLVVSDNGIGFDRGLLTSSGGLGLITMRERAGQLNGTFEFSTAPGNGTTIKVVIPFR